MTVGVIDIQPVVLFGHLFESHRQFISPGINHQNMKTLVFFAILYLRFTNANVSQELDEIDPKEAFLRYLHFQDSQHESEPLEKDHFQNIPQPGQFQFFNEETIAKIHKHRKRHNPEKIELDDKLIKNNNLRFKREAENNTKLENFRQKREPEIRTKKILLERDMHEGRMSDDREREERGATKEHWIKQPYPVERREQDNIPSASGSDSIRAPRVHFVTTQRRPETPNTQPALGFREREGRARDVDRERERDHPDRDLNLYPYPQPYPASSYSSPMYPPGSRAREYDLYRPRYYDPYYRHYDDRDRYAYETYNVARGRPMLPPPPPPPPPPPSPLFLPGPPEPSRQKQRRIIYYATLPEVVRNPTDNEEQRFRYRANYDDRYDRPDYRSQLQLQKQRQNEHEHKTNNNAAEQPKTPLYPVKVSTDVNVREPTKNPERRIYSDANRIFNYKSPSPNQSNF